MPGTEAQEFVVTIPAGTPSSAPVTTPTLLGTRVVRQINWRVPSGAKGLMGWRITSNNVPVLPITAGTWMITDGQSSNFTVGKLPNTGQFEVTGYNTGNFPHSVYITFMVDPITPPLQPAGTTMPEMFAESPDLSRAGAPVRRRR